MKQEAKTRKLAYVKVTRVHPSRLLPKREIDAQLAESIKRDGIQQPIIVRPSPQKSGMFEIIDGGIRYELVQENEIVLVDIRYGLDDVAIFRISEATFKRKPRNTYEQAVFYRNWVKTVEAKYGSRGAQVKVAKMANLSQSEVSHYLSISKLFKRLLSHNITERMFNALKSQSVNKLYALAKVEDKSVMLEVATKMAETSSMTLEEVKDLIRELASPIREIMQELDEDEEEHESVKMDELTSATQELEVTSDKARKVLTVFTARIVNNPHRFFSSSVIKRIKTMVKALKKIEKEANQIIRSERQAGA